MASRPASLTVSETAEVFNTSLSSVWRLLRAGELRSKQTGGRRWVDRRDVKRRARLRAPHPEPLSKNHPFVRMVAAFKSGGVGAGSENKRAVLFPK
jgi:excisionase family DNA binding protein